MQNGKVEIVKFRRLKAKHVIADNNLPRAEAQEEPVENFAIDRSTFIDYSCECRKYGALNNCEKCVERMKKIPRLKRPVIA